MKQKTALVWPIGLLVFAVTFNFWFFAFSVEAVTSNSPKIECNGIPGMQCIGLIERAFSVKIETNAALNRTVVAFSAKFATVEDSLQELFHNANLDNYSITYDSARQTYIVDFSMNVNAVGKQAKDDLANGFVAQQPESTENAEIRMPSIEQIEELAKNASNKYNNPDTIMEFNLGGSGKTLRMSVRQFNAMQERAANQVLNENNSVLPPDSGDFALTRKQLNDVINGTNMTTRDTEHVVLPNGIVITPPKNAADISK